MTGSRLTQCLVTDPAGSTMLSLLYGDFARPHSVEARNRFIQAPCCAENLSNYYILPLAARGQEGPAALPRYHDGTVCCIVSFRSFCVWLLPNTLGGCCALGGGRQLHHSTSNLGP